MKNFNPTDSGSFRGTERIRTATFSSTNDGRSVTDSRINLSSFVAFCHTAQPCFELAVTEAAGTGLVDCKISWS